MQFNTRLNPDTRQFNRL